MDFVLDRSEMEIIDCLLEDGENQTQASSNDTLTVSTKVFPQQLQHVTLKKPRKLKVTRLPRNDIRKQYFSAFLNLVNSFDIDLLSKFAQHYCRKNCRFDNMSSSSGELIPLPPDFHLLGIKPMLDYWKGIFISTPDACFRLSKLRVKERKDMKGSEVIAHVTLRGTTIYDLDLHDWLPAIKSPKTVYDGQDTVELDLKQKKELLKKLKMGDTRFSSLSKCDRDIFCHDLQVLATPKPVAIDYKMKMYLDATDTLDRCVFECRNGI